MTENKTRQKLSAQLSKRVHAASLKKGAQNSFAFAFRKIHPCSQR